MPKFESEIAKYHPVSPDPVFEGCQNTRLVEDGVVFPGVEPEIGAMMFIGRTSIIEAAAVLFERTPDFVVEALENYKPKRSTRRKELVIE